jgi:hypothetical protein
MAQVVDCLNSKYEAQSSSPVPPKQQQKFMTKNHNSGLKQQKTHSTSGILTHSNFSAMMEILFIAYIELLTTSRGQVHLKL